MFVHQKNHQWVADESAFASTRRFPALKIINGTHRGNSIASILGLPLRALGRLTDCSFEFNFCYDTSTTFCDEHLQTMSVDD